MTRKNNPFKRNRLAVGVAAMLTIGVGNLYAENTSMALDIKSQSAGKALLDLGEKAGVQIMVPPEMGRNVQLSGINGNYSLPEALDHMLEGTGLAYEFASDGVVVIRAQDSEPNQGDAEKDVDEEIVVTGTLLRNVHPTSPVVTISRDDIEKMGVSTVEDALRRLPQNRASFNSESSRNNNGFIDNTRPLASNGHQGNSAVNLRGLGSDATLVLINGRRTSGSPVAEGAFVNLSTIPLGIVERIEVLLDGASALYGSDAVGGVINIITSREYSGSETSARYENGLNGGNVYSLSQTLGFGWGSGDALVTLNKQERQATSTIKAGFTSLDFRPRGGSDFSGDAAVSGQAISPGGVFEVSTSGFGPGDLIGALPPGSDGVNANPNDFTPENALTAFAQEFLNRDFSALSENTSISIALKQQIAGIDAHLDINYSKAEHDGGDGTPTFVSTVPQANVFNPFNRDVFVFYRFTGELEAGLIGKTKTLTEQERMEISGGIEVELPFSNWQLDAAFTASREQSENIQSTYNFADGREAINFFGDGSAQTEDLEQFFTAFFPNAPKVTLLSLRTVAEGKLFDMTGGESRLAVGLEIRETEIDYTGDQFRSLVVTDFGAGDFANNGDELQNLTRKPKEELAALFAEVSLPLIGSDNQLPGVESFLVTLAARTERYDLPDARVGAGASYNHTSPKVGFVWDVNGEFSIRGTWGESFRAPTARQITAPDIELGFSLFDVLAPGGPARVPVNFHIGGNFNLQPQTSKTLTTGFRWAPELLEGAYLEAFYNQTDTSDVIVSLIPTAANLANPAVAIRTADGVLTDFIQTPVNLDDSSQKSIDIRAGYQFDTEFGAFVARFSGTYTKELQQDQFMSDLITNFRGTERGPSNWVARMDFGWSQDNYGANLAANYHSDFDYTNGGRLTEPDHVEHYTTWDATGYYELPDSGWKVQAGVLDLLHTPPPFVNNRSAPWDLSRVQSRGRVMYVEVKKTFDF